jgi:hypothetical protein
VLRLSAAVKNGAEWRLGAAPRFHTSSEGIEHERRIRSTCVRTPAAYQAAKGIDFETGRITRAWREANRDYVVAKKALRYPKIAGERPIVASRPTEQSDMPTGYREAA